MQQTSLFVLHAHAPWQVLGQITRDLRSLRQTRYRDQLAAQPDWLPTAQKSVAIAVYILSGHSPQVAAEFCAQKKGRAAAESDWSTTVETWYLACSIDQIVAYHHPEKPCDVRAVTIARKWLAERHTAHWVRDQNFSFGVAPSSVAMADKFVQLSGGAVAGTVARAGRTGRRFCQTMRKRWGIRLGVLKVRDDMPAQRIREKASRALSRGESKNGSTGMQRSCK
jgi:hypothetical protein